MYQNVRLVPLLTLFVLNLTLGASGDTIQVSDAQLQWVSDVTIASEVAGVVQELQIKPNDPIEVGQVFARLDSQQQEAELAVAQVQSEIATTESTNDIGVRFAEKSTEVSGKELERAEYAVAQYAKAVSQTELEKMQLEFKRAQLSHEQASLDLAVSRLNEKLRASEARLAEIKLAQRSIRSPVTGQVVETFVQVGEWVSPGAPIARVVDVHRLKAVALVPESEVTTVRRGQSAELQIEISKQKMEFKGEVTYVSPEINPVNGEFVVWVEIESRGENLRAGQIGVLTIERD